MPADYKPNSLRTASQPLSEADYRILSTAFRDAILDYGCKPNQVRLLLMLCRETFDDNRLAGAVDLTKWGLRLGIRSDKLEQGPWREVCDALIVDWNPGQGTYELRPDIRTWSRIVGLAHHKNLSAVQELPLVVSRPVSEALSEVSREAVLHKTDSGPGMQPGRISNDDTQSSPHDWQAELAALKQSLGPANPRAPAAEKSAMTWRKNPPQMAEKSATPQPSAERHLTKVAEKSATIRSDLILKKDLIFSAAEKSAEAWSWLRSIDLHRALALATNRAQWERLCQKDPDFVLSDLRKALNSGLLKAKQHGKELENPLGYVARAARNAKRLR